MTHGQESFPPADNRNNADWIASLQEAAGIREYIKGLDLGAKRRENARGLLNMMNAFSKTTGQGPEYLSEIATYGKPDGTLDIWDKPDAPQNEPTLQIKRTLVLDDSDPEFPDLNISVFDFHRSNTYVRWRDNFPDQIEWEPDPLFDKVAHASPERLRELRAELERFTQ